jgi:hypothetical protein
MPTTTAGTSEPTASTPMAVDSTPSAASPPAKKQKTAAAASGERTGEKAQYRVQKRGTAALPKKKFYRQRAHANPFSDHNLE